MLNRMWKSLNQTRNSDVPAPSTLPDFGTAESTINGSEQSAKTNVAPSVKNCVDPSEVTIVTACMNRVANLARVLPSWLALKPREIILCDWGSTTPLTLDALGVAEGHRDGIRILRREADRWILSWAFNEALADVTTPYTLKLDCDHLISDDFAVRNHCGRLQFTRGHWRSNTEREQSFINGAFLACSELLREVGYFDERITTYGWDDSDLYARLYDRATAAFILASDTVIHVDQGDDERTAHQKTTLESVLARAVGLRVTDFMILRNRFLCGLMWHWTAEKFSGRASIRNTYSGVGLYNNPLLCLATYLVYREFRFQRPTEHKDHRASDAAFVEAYDDFCARAYGLKPLAVRLPQFYSKFASALRTGDHESAQAFAFALTSSTSAEVSRTRLQTMQNISRELGLDPSLRKDLAAAPAGRIILVPQHGLGNRLRTVASAISIAEATGKSLEVFWQRDVHLDATFSDLFAIDHLPFSFVEASELRALRDCRHYDYMDGSPFCCKGEVIDTESQLPLIVKSSSVLVHPASHWTADCQQLNKLRPSAQVHSILDQFKTTDLSPVIGVHIRSLRTDTPDARPSDTALHWGEEAHRKISAARRQSQPEAFLSVLEKIIHSNPHQMFFLAADSPQAWDAVREAYPNNCLFLAKPAAAYGRDTHSLQYALADAVLLSRCQRLIGSPYSSYTELVCRLANRPNFISTIDAMTESSTINAP